MDILAVLLAAILVEAIISALKPIWDEEKRIFSASGVLSLTVGIVIAFAAQLDFPADVGIRLSWPILPQLISGVIISRGSNYLHDLLNKFSQTA